MNADLVALTACVTGYGQYLAGEGIMSLGRAFQCAGARSSLVSLWSVAEESSVKLVGNFFRHLKEGKGKLEAWQTARADLRNEGYKHPFFWAPFILVGETKPANLVQIAAKASETVSDGKEDLIRTMGFPSPEETSQGVEPSGPGFAVVRVVDQPDGCLRVRSAPSSSSKVVACPELHNRLRLTGVKKAQWFEIDRPVKGWVNARQVGIHESAIEEGSSSSD
jgi:hypothetical protein